MFLMLISWSSKTSASARFILVSQPFSILDRSFRYFFLLVSNLLFSCSSLGRHPSFRFSNSSWSFRLNAPPPFKPCLSVKTSISLLRTALRLDLPTIVSLYCLAPRTCSVGFWADKCCQSRFSYESAALSLDIFF